MKSDYEQTLYENFKKAVNLCSATYSDSELIDLLKSGNIPEKQYAALEIKKLSSKEEAKIFLSNLINCDGKIREAVAQKFSEFVENETYREYFYNYPETFAKSTIDINANISRMVIDGLTLMSDYPQFGRAYAKHLIYYIKDAFENLDKIIYKDKKYTINKQLFKLYWCLEGLSQYSKYLEEEVLLEILKKSLKQKEYTIREKVAQIVIHQTSDKFREIYEELKSDENYYVQRILKESTL